MTDLEGVVRKRLPWGEYLRVGLAAGEGVDAPEVCGYRWRGIDGKEHVCRRRGLHICLPVWEDVKQHAAIGMRLVKPDRHSPSGFTTLRETIKEPTQLRCVGKLLSVKLWSEEYGRYVRRYRRLDNRQPRRTGKSWKIEFISSWYLTREHNIQIALAAQSMESASLGMWRAVQTMCRQSIVCRTAKVRVPKGNDPILCSSTASQIVLVPSVGDKIRGLDYPALCILDEVRAVKDAREWLANAEASQLNLEEPLIATCTTPADSPESFEMERFERLLEIAADPSVEPTTLPELHHLPTGASWHDKKLWHVANPGLGKIKKFGLMESLYHKCLGIPAEEVIFRREHLCELVEDAAGVVDAELWEACEQGTAEEAFDLIAGCADVIAGADLSWGSDLTSLALIARHTDGKLWVWHHSWLHWAKLANQPDDFIHRVQHWHDAGRLTIIREDEAPPSDLFVDFVARQMAEIISRLPDGVVMLGYDAARAVPAAVVWDEAGIPAKQVKQGQWLDDAIATFQDMVRSDQIRHGEDVLLTSAVINSVIQRLGSYDRRCIKRNDSRIKFGIRIDPLVAAVSAVEVLLRPEPDERLGSGFEMPDGSRRSVMMADEFIKMAENGGDVSVG